MKDKAIFKYNSGLLALLCSRCSKIIRVGRDFNLEEMKACQGKATLGPQYCEKCKIDNYDNRRM